MRRKREQVQEPKPTVYTYLYEDLTPLVREKVTQEYPDLKKGDHVELPAPMELLEKNCRDSFSKEYFEMDEADYINNVVILDVVQRVDTGRSNSKVTSVKSSGTVLKELRRKWLK